MLKRLFPKKAPTSYDIAKIEYSGVFITSDQTEEIARRETLASAKRLSSAKRRRCAVIVVRMWPKNTGAPI